jgi:hypothetical protein
MATTEYLVIMTTPVPEATPGKAVEDIRGLAEAPGRKRWQRITPIR